MDEFEIIEYKWLKCLFTHEQLNIMLRTKMNDLRKNSIKTLSEHFTKGLNKNKIPMFRTSIMSK